jgi:hypothetical protein
VSEASGKLKIEVINKNRCSGSVRVKTVDAEAMAGQDYEAFEKTINFKDGQESDSFEIKIIDDEGWEPDEDFYVQLYNSDTLEELWG